MKTHSNRWPLLAGLALGALLLALRWAVAEATLPVPGPPSVEQKPEKPRADVRYANAADEVPDFQRHVSPLLGRLGCNGRACHGSFQGQGGFRLSLFGYDFKSDLAALTQEKASGADHPRANVKDPKQSLILRKPTLAQEHEGGKRMEPDGWQYRLLLKWIESGGKGVAENAPTLSRLEITPREIVFQKAAEKVSLKAVAHWSDGTREDVTPLCRYRTNDESVATIDEAGVVTAAGKGSTHVVAFYDNGVAPVQTMLPVSDLLADRYPPTPTPTRIDELVVAKLKQLGIVQSDVCSDADFLRRASLDITGSLPTPKEIEAFLADASSGKRERKIDELLESPAYAAWWTTRLCDWTGNNARNAGERQLGDQTARQWYEWIHRRVKENTPYDELVAGIVLAVSRKPGQSFDEYCKEMSSYYRDADPADYSQRATLAHFWTQGRGNMQAKDKALTFGYAFLGVRLQCAECHKHPFDQWTKDDFDHFTAFFAPLAYAPAPDSRAQFQQMMEKVAGNQKGGMAQRKLAQAVRSGDAVPWRELFVVRNRQGEPVARGQNQLKRPKNKNRIQPGRVVTPKLLGGDEVVWQKFDDPRGPLMEWLRDDENPYFARALVNRVWANYFGVGIIDPPDDLNLANPPSNEPLLDYLTKSFIEHKYDMKWLHREIARSRTYQLSWQVNDTNRLDNRHFSHAMPRRIPAEVLYDGIQQATMTDDKAATFRQDRSVRATGPMSGFVRNPKAQFALTVFGKPTRETNCDCERSTEPSLLQTLFLRNDNDVLSAIDRSDGWLAETSARLGEPFRGIPPNNPDRPRAKGKGVKARPPEPDDRAELELRIAQVQRRAAMLRAAGNNEQAKKAQRRVQRLRAELRSLAAAGRLPDAKASEKLDKKPANNPAKGRTITGAELQDLIRQAYLRTLNRPPSSDELERVGKHMAAAKTRTEGLRDLMWALLNSKEFVLNH
jgi:hypothetical protein